MSELKPCPFDGKYPEHSKTNKGHCFYCPKCMSSPVGRFKTMQKAILAWNRTHPNYQR